jgi:hypothetical protein
VIWESRAREKSAKVVLGRVLINAQIAAGYALTWRLRYSHVFLRNATWSKKRRFVQETAIDTCAVKPTLIG